MKTLLKNLIVCNFILLTLSCDSIEKTDCLTILVNSDTETSLALSEISEKIEAIELEVTDESLIQKVSCVLYSPDLIIVQEWKSIMLFDNNGKFLRQIGSVGQGPGEYTGISSIAADFDSKKIFIFSDDGKLLCYDFEGSFLRQSPTGYYSRTRNPYINYIDNKLFFLSEYFAIIKENDIKNQRFLFFVNDDLLKTDSILVRQIDLSQFEIGYAPSYEYLTKEGYNTYLYYNVIVPTHIVSDTLYQISNNQIIPHLNIKFNNRGLNSEGKKNIYIGNIYRSSRYVFTPYTYITKGLNYFFCHDLKISESYNMKDGIMDDIYTKKKVIIRPVNNDSNKYYYLHTNIKDNEINEPNPTLYIGLLKK